MRKALDTTLAKLKSSSGPQSLAFISLQNALTLLKEVAGKTGVPGLQEGIKGFVILLDAIQVCEMHIICHAVVLLTNPLRRKPRRTAVTWNHWTVAFET